MWNGVFIIIATNGHRPVSLIKHDGCISRVDICMVKASTQNLGFATPIKKAGPKTPP